jgi:hypothetical protein
MVPVVTAVLGFKVQKCLTCSIAPLTYNMAQITVALKFLLLHNLEQLLKGGCILPCCKSSSLPVVKKLCFSGKWFAIWKSVPPLLPCPPEKGQLFSTLFLWHMMLHH